MPITQDRMIKLLEITQTVLTWHDKIITLTKSRELNDVIQTLNSAKNDPNMPEYMKNLLQMALGQLNLYNNIINDVILPYELREKYIEEKVHFKLTQKSNERAKKYKQAVRSGTIAPEKRQAEKPFYAMTKEEQEEIDMAIKLQNEQIAKGEFKMPKYKDLVKMKDGNDGEIEDEKDENVKTAMAEPDWTKTRPDEEVNVVGMMPRIGHRTDRETLAASDGPDVGDGPDAPSDGQGDATYTMPHGAPSDPIIVRSDKT